MSDYQRIARAIEFVRTNARAQPSLEDIAEAVHLSPWHLQRLFSRWAGVTPKRFLQALTVEDAKVRLMSGRESLLRVAGDVGLNSASSLYDHFVTLEAVTPDEYRKMGLDLRLEVAFHETPLGLLFVATTDRGICHISFVEDDKAMALHTLQAQWPGAEIEINAQTGAALVEQLFSANPDRLQRPLSLWVKGTNFQISVWRALLALDQRALTTYGDVAASIGRPKAVRAVGSAVGANPLALIIPCHRVIRADGEIGGYRWGETRKRALLAREATRTRTGE